MSDPKDDEDDVQMPSSSEEEDDDEEKDAALQARLDACTKALADNPYNYDSLVERVTVLKEMGELAREAREDFASKYPLTTELWLSWIKDEQSIATTDEENQAVLALFERARLDYLSVPLYLEYCQTVCGSVGSQEANLAARQVFEKAVAAVGLHLAKGALVWDTYREFEMVLLQCNPADDAQRGRVEKLFSRQLSVPLRDMDSTLEEYLQWSGQEKPGKQLELAYGEAKAMLNARVQLEDKLMQLADGGDTHSVFKDYIELELSSGNPARIQCMYERRLAAHCLVPDYWLEYVRYLDTQLKNGDVSLSVHERAVRNCYWSGDLWVSYMRAGERYGCEDARLTFIFEKSLTVPGGLARPNDYLFVWLAYLEHRRRRAFTDDSNEARDDENRGKKKQLLRDLFSRAVSYLVTIEGADPDCKAARFWATLEADRFDSMEKARTIWTDILSVAGQQAQVCLEYLLLEKMYGDTKHLRKLYPRLLEKCRDAPESIGRAWIQFEKEEGTFAQLEEAEAKVSKRLARAEEQRVRAEETDAKSVALKLEKAERKKERDKDKRRERRRQEAEQKRTERKRAHSGDYIEPAAAKKALATLDSDGFKVPSLGAGGAIGPPPGFKKARGGVAPPPGFDKGKSAASAVDAPPGPGFVAPAGLAGSGEQGNSQGDKDRSVFVSNLNFAVTADELKEVMEKSGKVQEVRLVKTPAGKSKGFAFVVFEEASSARATLQRDREKVGGRPMFVSVVDEAKSGHEFQYGRGLEKNKLFVKNLPQTMKQYDVAKLFAPYGSIKAVRLIEFRNGHSKGIAYVEFEEESDAARAVIAADGLVVEDRTIEVAISNPPAKAANKQQTSSDSSVKSLGSHRGGGAARSTGGRGRGKSNLGALLPRALMTKKAEESKNRSGNGVLSAPKSNQQFRDLLLKKE